MGAEKEGADSVILTNLDRSISATENIVVGGYVM